MDKKLSEITMSGAIRLIRELAAVGVLAYLCVRLFSGDLSLDFGKLTSSELVSFLLAFFSIGLSAAFYFAATNQSNQFYDNVNKFSKDTAELLGRLDEQVKGLGGRQSELKHSIDQYYLKDNSKANEVKEVEAKAEEVKENLAQMLKELLDKSGLSEEERSKFEEKLRKKDEELGNLREQMGRLSNEYSTELFNYVLRHIDKTGLNRIMKIPVNQIIHELYVQAPVSVKNELIKNDYIMFEEADAKPKATTSGFGFIMKAIDHYKEQTKYIN